MRTVVIGLGNPILTDDSVGIHVARCLRARLDGQGTSLATAVTEAHTGGLDLMDAMVGYDRAIIVDAMVTGKCLPGSVRTFDDGPACLCTRNAHSTHSASLEVALHAGREIGLHLPVRISVLGIEAGDVETFGYKLTGPVAASVPRVVEMILQELGVDGLALHALRSGIMAEGGQA